ncbi:MAG: glycosyltransferase [Pirellulales bacterium]|nr:glycosyltransferase [Pirellulales bacterium]
MIRYSLLVPLSCGVEHFERQLPALCDALEALDPAHEIVCIDDATEEQAALDRLRAKFPVLRRVSLAERAGTTACLSAGIAAAQGEILIALEAGERYSASDIPRMVERLSRADLVWGRRRQTRFQKTLLATRHLPRRLLLGTDAHDPGCLFWAARHETVAGLPPLPGLVRHLATWTARRGFRVGEIYVDHQQPSHAPTTSDRRTRPGELFAIWWQARRWRAQSSAEIAAQDERVRLHRSAHASTDPRRSSAAASSTNEPRLRRSA